MQITPSKALDMLRSGTEAFLRRYSIRILQAPAGTSTSPANYWIEDDTARVGVPTRPDSVLKQLRPHATQIFYIRHQSLVRGMPAGRGAKLFSAHSVGMWSSIDPYKIQCHTLPAAGGPDLMLTGELTGCSFAIHDNGNGSLVVAHIKPHSGLHAKPLQGTLERIKYWKVVYGAKSFDTGTMHASIVGCRSGARWKIYAQTADLMAPFSIRQVERIF